MLYDEFLQQKAQRVPCCGFTFEKSEMNEALFDWQKDIVCWALKKGKAALFEDCGLGKTVQQLEWCRIVSNHTQKPTLILAPLAVSNQTKNEGNKFGYDVAVCRTQKDVKQGINITNYEMLEHFDISRFGGVVLDESSILKHYSGKMRTQIIESCNGIAYKLSCTATPAPNDYMNIVQNSRAYSLPGQDYANSITLDTSISRCTAKGEGWHLTTRLEWMAVALWCLKNGTLPLGNNNYGRDHTETVYKAIPKTKDAEGKTLHVAGGTGPLTWSHNRQQDGIWDLNGNGYEWVGGVRTVYGELQVLSKDGVTFGNDAADPDNSQSASSALWYAIDGTTGALIAPNGSGTTTHSLKIDKVGTKMTWVTGAISMATPGQISGTLESVELDVSVCDAAKHILQALGLYKPDDITAGALGGDYVYFDNAQAERSSCCGGNYGDSSSAGVFFAYGSNSRTYSNSSTSLRAAYCDLPTA